MMILITISLNLRCFSKSCNHTQRLEQLIYVQGISQILEVLLLLDEGLSFVVILVLRLNIVILILLRVFNTLKEVAAMTSLS